MAQNSDNKSDINDCIESDEQIVNNNDIEINCQTIESLNNQMSGHSSDHQMMDSLIDSNCDNLCLNNDIISDSNSNQNNCLNNSDEQQNENQNNVNIESDVNESTNDSKLDTNKSSSDSGEEEENLLRYDPTPTVPYPSVKWRSLQQLTNREYGNLLKPGNTRPINSYDSQWFRRYAYNSLYFFQRLELMAKLEEHNGCVNCLNFNSSGDLLISGSDDLRIAIWDWQKSELKYAYHSGHSSNVFQCRFCADNNHIVSCARDGQIRICNINQKGTTVSNKLAQHRGAAHKLTLSSPQVILSCGEDAVVFEVDLRADKPNKLMIVKNEKEHKVPLYSINTNMAFSPTHFAVSGRDPFVRIYDRRSLRSDNSTVSPVLSLCPENLKQSKHSVTCTQYNPNADQLLATYNDESIYTFNAKTGSVEHSYSGHRNNATVKGCSWFGDQYIVSGSDDGHVYGWDVETEHIVMSLYADETGVVNCIEPHPTTPIMATSGLDDNVKLWVPSADDWPQTLKGMKQRICTNVRERQRSHRRLRDLDESDAIDASVLYFLISEMRRQIPRRRHRRRTENANNHHSNEGNEDDSDEDRGHDDDESTDTHESDSDSDAGQQQCMPS